MGAKTILVAFSLIAPSSTPTPIAPGRWIISNQMYEVLFNGKRDDNAFPLSKPRSTCLSAANAARGPGLAFSDPNMCKVLNTTMSDTSFAFETECKATESDDLIWTKSEGHYSTGSYTGMSTSVQQRDGMRVEMRSRFDAKQVGEC